jgi:hypothetical protein
VFMRAREPDRFAEHLLELRRAPRARA